MEIRFLPNPNYQEADKTSPVFFPPQRKAVTDDVLAGEGRAAPNCPLSSSYDKDESKERRYPQQPHRAIQQGRHQ